MSEAVVPSSSAQSVSAATDTRTLHGIVVDDPHRWLEAIDDPRVQQWVDAQDQAALGDMLRESAQRRLTIADRMVATRRQSGLGATAALTFKTYPGTSIESSARTWALADRCSLFPFSQVPLLLVSVT
jgi:hypothetical protein